MNLLPMIIAAALPLGVAASPLTWDTVPGDGGTTTSGSGTWDLSESSWNDGHDSGPWRNGAEARFAPEADGVSWITVGDDPVQASSVSVGGQGTAVLRGALKNLSTPELKVQSTGAGKLALINASSESGALAATTVADGATLYMSNSTVQTSLRVSGPGNSENRGALRIEDGSILRGQVQLTGPTTIGSGSGRGTIEAALSGAQPLTKIGSGEIRLSGPTSIQGPVDVQAGTLQLGAAARLPKDLQIYPLGDSITYGYPAPGGYRSPLASLLSPAARNLELVGDSQVNPGDLPAEQRSHGGHSSYSTWDIERNLAGLDTETFAQYGDTSRDPHGGHWLTGLDKPLTYTVPGQGTFTYGPRPALDPDVILLLVGTNDVFRLGWDQEVDGGVTVARRHYEAMLAKLTAMRPKAHVLAATITPYNNAANSPENQRVAAYNTMVADVVSEYRDDGARVRLVDLNTGYTSGFADDLHPDAAGYRWMATMWEAALVSELGRPTTEPDLRGAGRVTVAGGAVLAGHGRLPRLDVAGTLVPQSEVAGFATMQAASATLSGTLQLRVGGDGADRLAVDTDLVLAGARLALRATGTPPRGRQILATWRGTVRGDFVDVSGVPQGCQVERETAVRQIVLDCAGLR